MLDIDIAPAHSESTTIRAKIERGERLNIADGLRLYETDDLATLRHLAEQMAAAHQPLTPRAVNMHLCYAPYYAAACAFCGYRHLAQERQATTLTVDEIIQGKMPIDPAITEFHLYGGAPAGQSISYYEATLRALKVTYPAIRIKAFTAIEIWLLSVTAHLSITAVCERLMVAGLAALASGEAEIITACARKAIVPNADDDAQWLAIHRIAHGVGLTSSATLLYGTHELPSARVEHLLSVRALQDVTGGFTDFIALPYPARHAPSVEDMLRTQLVSALLLDNVPPSADTTAIAATLSRGEATHTHRHKY